MNIVYQIQLAKLLATPDPTELNLPKTARIIALLLRDWEPGDRTKFNPREDMTSQEIVCALEDMATLTVNDIAETMSWLGFEMTPTREKGHVWSMRFTGLKAVDDE